MILLVRWFDRPVQIRRENLGRDSRFDYLLRRPGEVPADALTCQEYNLRRQSPRAFPMTRFVLYACMAFVTAFVGVFWAARGFPTHFPSPVSFKPLERTVSTTFGDDSSAKKREELVQQQLQDPDNAKRNPLRADTLQAATGFALSPCNKAMKADLVAATRAYAAGFQELRKCNPMFQKNCDPVHDKAAAIYGTPFDLRVQEALHEAFEKGGISYVDFPPELQMSVMSLANSRGNPVSACGITAERVRP
jgi:hypothetical protein